MLTKLTEQEKKDAEEVWGAPSSAWGSYNRIYVTYEAGLIAGRAEGAALRKAAEALLEAVMTSRFPIPLWGEWGKELTALRELLFAQSAKPSPGTTADAVQDAELTDAESWECAYCGFGAFGWKRDGKCSRCNHSIGHRTAPIAAPGDRTDAWDARQDAAAEAIRRIEDYLNGPLHEWLKGVAHTWADAVREPPHFEPLRKQAVEEKEKQ